MNWADRHRSLFFPVLLIAVIVIAVLFHRPQMKPMHERLVSTDHDVRNLALFNFVKQSQEKRQALIPSLLEHVSNENPDSRRFALYSLRIINQPTPDVLRSATRSLLDLNRKVRREAFHLVLMMSPPAIPPLLKVFHKLTPTLQKRFVTSYASIGDQIAPVLAAHLRDASLMRRINATRLLIGIGLLSESMKSDLKNLLNGKNNEARYYSALALAQLGGEDKNLLRVFKGWLQKRDWSDRQYVILASIRQMGPRAKDLKPTLEGLLQTKKDGFKAGPYPRPALAQTLNAIDPRPTTQEGLMWDLKQRNPVTRYRAVWFLSEMESINRGFVPHLVAVLDDVWLPTRARALFCLGKIGLSKAKRFEKKIIRSARTGVRLNEKAKQVDGYSDMANSVISGAQ